MPNRLNVLYPKAFQPAILEDLRAQVAEGVEVGGEPSEMPDCDVLIEGRVTREELQGFPNLKAVIIPFAGVPDATLASVRASSGITLHNLHHNAADTAELALALLLACSRWVVPMDQNLRKGDWSPRYQVSPSVRLDGKTALVLGYGHIGKHIARGCKGLGMNVLAIRKRAKHDNDGVAEIHPIDDLAALLPKANVLIVALPQTPETTGLLGAKELALLPEGAILVNIARGPIIQEEPLFNALKERHFHSAGLDVWYRYPNESSPAAVPGYFEMPDSALNTFPSAFPFQDLENVVMSPHRGGTSHDSEVLRVAALAEMLNDMAKGKPLPNQIDLSTGY